MTNRQQKRAAQRTRAKQAAKQKAGVMSPDQAANMLMQTVQMNRADAVTKLLDNLFTVDELEPTIARLGGVGGPTGTITLERIQEVANGAIAAGVILPRTAEVPEGMEAVGTIQPPDLEDATQGGPEVPPGDPVEFHEGLMSTLEQVDAPSVTVSSDAVVEPEPDMSEFDTVES